MASKLADDEIILELNEIPDDMAFDSDFESDCDAEDSKIVSNFACSLGCEN